MEKLKWLFISLLLAILVVVIFYTPSIKDSRDGKNQALISIKHLNLGSNNYRRIIVEEGEYTLFLQEFQRISGRGDGWRLLFSRPYEGYEIFMIFDIVDTSGFIMDSIYPKNIFYSNYEKYNYLNTHSFLRGSFRVGYTKKHDNIIIEEDFIPMMIFSCKIDTAWVQDTIGGMKMSFYATHSDLMEGAYNMRYAMQGNLSIDSASAYKRIIQ